MESSKKSLVRRDAPVWVCSALILLLLVLPTGFEDSRVFQESDIRPALVLSTDESTVIDTGLIRSGEQRCQLEILGGPFRGRRAEGRNMLNGSLEQDKLFVSDVQVKWMCLNCGQIIDATMAPAVCPVCKHPQGYFIRWEMAPFE